MIILNSGPGSYVSIEGKRYSYFGGNNYLGLAGHPEVKMAAIRAIEKYGVNFSASRVTTGTSGLHIELEKKLSAFKKKDDTITFPSGYLGNRILLGALAGPGSALLIDSLAHPSIEDSVPGHVTSVRHYNHCDVGHLENIIKKLPSGLKPVIITDGIFALTGEIAPLDEIQIVALRYNALVIVDDAHSTGVLGQNGRGTVEHFNLEDAGNIYQSETMSKALGSYGGFISGDRRFMSLLRKGSDIYRASTALPPHIVAAGIASVSIITKNPGMKEKLIEKASFLRNEITGMGLGTAGGETPIIPVIFGSPSAASSLSRFLEINGIIAPAIDYPNKLDKYIVRITLCTGHSDQQVESLLSFIKKWKDRNGSFENQENNHRADQHFAG